MKILIVDDNIDDLTLLQHIVERNGHVPIKAQNGQEALDLAASQMPDLIISDALMPVMDGFVFLKKLKMDEVLKSIPFIFYSAAYQEDKDMALATRLGACAYILKPKAPDDLWAEVLQTYTRCQTETKVSTKLLKEDEVEYLEQYSKIVATKLEEKVAELEEALRQRQEAEEKLKEQSEFLQNALDALTHPFYVVNINDYTIALANKASRFTEFKEGTTCHQLTHNRNEPCGGKDHPCTIDKIKKRQGPVVLEHTHYNEAGEKRSVEVHGYPLFGANGEIVQVIEYCIDVTEREKLKGQLQQAQKMEAIGTLAGGIAHDFNNILTAIIGYSDLALEQLPEESILRMPQEQVLKAGYRAKELVRQILTFCRQTHQERMPVEFHLVVNEATNLLRSSIPTSIEIKKNIDQESGMVLADPTQLHQIVMNLGTNAYHAMRETGGVLTIDLSVEEIDKNNILARIYDLSPGSYVKLGVYDTGFGMDKQTVEKIFDPYFTTKNKGEGTGLGLAMVHGIVKSYDGHISVNSEPGKGTKFQVYIPRIQTEQNISTTEIIKDPRGTEKILLVDDEEDIAKMQQQMLESLGYQICAMTDSNELLQRFKNAPEDFDLILTDMAMPDMSGVELSQKVLAIRPDIPVIICTGYSELINKEKAKTLGIKEYILKPISKSELAQVVRKALDENKA
jgi:CheY-like chemotaxis protein